MDSLTAAVQQHLLIIADWSIIQYMYKNDLFVLLTQCVRGPQGAGSAVLVGLRVPGGQRFGYRCSGAIRRVVGPVQSELQCRTLRKALEWRQTLQKDRWFYYTRLKVNLNQYVGFLLSHKTISQHGLCGNTVNCSFTWNIL